MASSPIPVLSLRSLAPPAFADTLGASLREYGFAMVCDHGIEQALITRCWRQARELFALPDAVKRGYHVAGLAGQRGYTPFATEIAKGAARSDLKEFWHVGRSAPHNASLPGNIWPKEIPRFREDFEQLYTAFDHVGAQILSAIATHLGLTAAWFDPAIAAGNSILRLLHYPPIAPNADAVRAEAHEDINLITLLLGAEESGLELLRRDGQWMPVAPPPGALVVNIGDMLQRLTNHVLPSTSHRVVNPPPDRRDRSRYSMPFFLHLAPDFVIDALPGCVSEANPRREPPITAQAYLDERLSEIGLT